MNNKIKFILVGLTIFIIGAVCFAFELKRFEIRNDLTSNFELKQKTMNYSITNNEIFRITNTNGNYNVNLYVDNNLSDEVKIVVSYLDVSELKYDYHDVNDGDINLISINFASSLLLDFNNIKDIYRLGIISFKENVIYDYSLLDKPKVKVFVNEKYKKNIQFVGNYGKVYNPIG